MINGCDVSAGLLIDDLVDYLANCSIDISSLAGIPSTVGGAIYGNAGAYGLDIGQLIDYCYVHNGYEFYRLDNCQFDYRSSCFKTNGLSIISCHLKNLESRRCLETHTAVKNVRNKRQCKYPNDNNIGCIFKNPQVPIGKLLNDYNLLSDCFKFHDTHHNILINIGQDTTIADFTAVTKELKDYIEQLGHIANMEVEIKD